MPEVHSDAMRIFMPHLVLSVRMTQRCCCKVIRDWQSYVTMCQLLKLPMQTNCYIIKFQKNSLKQFWPGWIYNDKDCCFLPAFFEAYFSSLYSLFSILNALWGLTFLILGWPNFACFPYAIFHDLQPLSHQSHTVLFQSIFHRHLTFQQLQKGHPYVKLTTYGIISILYMPLKCLPEIGGRCMHFKY